MSPAGPAQSQPNRGAPSLTELAGSVELTLAALRQSLGWSRGGRLTPEDSISIGVRGSNVRGLIWAQQRGLVVARPRFGVTL